MKHQSECICVDCENERTNNVIRRAREWLGNSEVAIPAEIVIDLVDELEARLSLEEERDALADALQDRGGKVQIRLSTVFAIDSLLSWVAHRGWCIDRAEDRQLTHDIISELRKIEKQAEEREQ